MADLELTSSIQIKGNVYRSFIVRSHYWELSANININSLVKAFLLEGVKCINCQFNLSRSLIKNGLKCYREARLKDENLIINCRMFKRIKE
jgi:hypothetical protein